MKEGGREEGGHVVLFRLPHQLRNMEQTLKQAFHDRKGGVNVTKRRI